STPRSSGLWIAALLAGCGSREELTWPVDQVGHYRVAYRESMVKYVPEGDSEERALRLAIWYPTSATNGHAGKYMDAWERPDVIANAPILDRDDLPIALFSHGNLTFAEQSWFLPEYLASHGFVVLGPDHTGNTIVNAGEDMRSPEFFRWRPLDL